MIYFFVFDIIFLEVHMKFISWNVNGLRACANKGFFDFLKGESPDFLCIQETKLQDGQMDLFVDGYYTFLNSAEKKGYSGTLVYAKQKPISEVYGIDGKYNDEGRVITLEYEEFYLVCGYVPNSQEGLKRIEYREIFEDDMRAYLVSLDKKKPVLYCGDLNVARTPMDLKNPKANEKNAGYSIQERTKMEELLGAGFVDTFRFLHPDEVKYSWWSYRFDARNKNIGWRIDYFLVSDRLKKSIKKADIYAEVLGSDHAPVMIEIDNFD